MFQYYCLFDAEYTNYLLKVIGKTPTVLLSLIILTNILLANKLDHSSGPIKQIECSI